MNLLCLTHEEEIGRLEILNGIKTLGWMLYSTDKSRRLVLVITAKYLRPMEYHTANITQVTHKQIREAEKKINNHSRAFGKIFNIGQIFNKCPSVTTLLLSTLVMLHSYKDLEKIISNMILYLANLLGHCYLQEALQMLFCLTCKPSSSEGWHRSYLLTLEQRQIVEKIYVITSTITTIQTAKIILRFRSPATQSSMTMTTQMPTVRKKYIQTQTML